VDQVYNTGPTRPSAGCKATDSGLALELKNHQMCSKLIVFLDAIGP
jgi:hypothetical protein